MTNEHNKPMSQPDKLTLTYTQIPEDTVALLLRKKYCVIFPSNSNPALQELIPEKGIKTNVVYDLASLIPSLVKDERPQSLISYLETRGSANLLITGNLDNLLLINSNCNSLFKNIPLGWIPVIDYTKKHGFLLSHISITKDEDRLIVTTNPD